MWNIQAQLLAEEEEKPTSPPSARVKTEPKNGVKRHSSDEPSPAAKRQKKLPTSSKKAKSKKEESESELSESESEDEVSASSIARRCSMISFGAFYHEKKVKRQRRNKTKGRTNL